MTGLGDRPGGPIARPTNPVAEGHVDLFWLPLGAGGRSVRWNGRVFEAVAARAAHRPISDLYHSALEVQLGPDRFVIEMAPAWTGDGVQRGVVLTGPVGSRWLSRSRLFRYEVRRWKEGSIPDVAEAVASPRRVSDHPRSAASLLDLVEHFPACTWGRDEQAAGEMWNSNSLTAWLLARTGHDVASITPPAGGRAPGWAAGLEVARRQGSPGGRATRVRAALRPDLG